MCQIKIDERDGKIAVYSPYNPSLPSAAKKLGGKWNREAWVYDSRLLDDVANLYRKVYGEWPGDVQDNVRVRATATEDIRADREGIFLFGRGVARAFGRDSGAKLGDGIILREGHFTSGGSAKYWETQCRKGTVIEMMDVPRTSVGEAEGWTIEILEEAPSIDRAALEAEKERLLARIAQIDELLNK